MRYKCLLPCKFGGDFGEHVRNCLHPQILKELGLENFSDVVPVVDLAYCANCPYLTFEEKKHGKRKKRSR